MIYLVATKDGERKMKELLGDAKEQIFVMGVGGMNAVRALCEAFPEGAKGPDGAPEFFLNIGYVGSNTLPIGTVTTVAKVHTFHAAVDFVEEPITLTPATLDDIPDPAVRAWVEGALADAGQSADEPLLPATCYTNTDFVTCADHIDEPCIFDMELAFAAATGLDIRAIKIVSDNLSVHEYEDTVSQ